MDNIETSKPTTDPATESSEASSQVTAAETEQKQISQDQLQTLKTIVTFLKDRATIADNEKEQAKQVTKQSKTEEDEFRASVTSALSEEPEPLAQEVTAMQTDLLQEIVANTKNNALDNEAGSLAYYANGGLIFVTLVVIPLLLVAKLAKSTFSFTKYI